MINLNNVIIEYPLMQFNSHSLRARIEYFLRLRKGSDYKEISPKVVGLNDVTLSINPGDRVSVIGHNGAGKTTLLRAMSGIYPSTSTKGRISVEGSISSIIDISFGFEDELSGIKNIELGLVFAGKTFSQAKELAPIIAHEALIGDAIHRPIYTYSTGMALRVAFALATYEQPEILIMDEILGAGDEAFRSIAQNKIDNLIDNSKICVLSTHDLAAVRKYTTKCLLMNKGSVQFYGDVEEAIDIYLSDVHKQ